MAENKRIIVSLPESLLEEVDGIVSMEKRNRNDFIKEALNRVVCERRKAGMREQMRLGYQEMGQINLSIVKDLYQAEQEATVYYEDKLAWSVGYEY
ncbi:MAG: ribbon-helix-helix protein, CopG family [Eubacteriales bacterium]